MLDLDRIDPHVVSINSRLLRKLAGLTQVELAKSAGIHVMTIRRAENLVIEYSQVHANSVVLACYLMISDDDIKLFTKLVTEPMCLPIEWHNTDPRGMSKLDIFGINLKRFVFVSA